MEPFCPPPAAMPRPNSVSAAPPGSGRPLPRQCRVCAQAGDGGPAGPCGGLVRARVARGSQPARPPGPLAARGKPPELVFGRGRAGPCCLDGCPARPLASRGAGHGRWRAADRDGPPGAGYRAGRGEAWLWQSAAGGRYRGDPGSVTWAGLTGGPIPGRSDHSPGLCLRTRADPGQPRALGSGFWTRESSFQAAGLSRARVM
jgi:hypothetical protein